MSKLDDDPQTVDTDDFLDWLKFEGEQTTPADPIEVVWRRKVDADREWNLRCLQYSSIVWRDSRRTDPRRPATEALAYVDKETIAQAREEEPDDDRRFLKIIAHFAEQKAYREAREAEVEKEKSADNHTPAAPDSGVRTMIVCPALPTAGYNDKKLADAYKHIANTPLPLIVAPDVRGARQRLVAEQPWAVDAVDALLQPTFRRWSQGAAEIDIGPILLVGSPGSGKSRLARRVCQELGAGFVQTSISGALDDHVLGVSKGWSTAIPSVILTAISETRSANPVLIIDEIEKAGKSQNGDFLAKLLPLLEKTEAKAWREPYLAVPFDTTRVNWIFTANSLDGIPEPLKNRLKIVHVPKPGPEHIGVIVRRILDEIADEQGVDRRWYPTFDREIMDALRNQLVKHGSVRVLRRQVEAALEARKIHSV